MESEYATIDIFAFYILCSTFTGILCVHIQQVYCSLRCVRVFIVIP